MLRTILFFCAVSALLTTGALSQSGIETYYVTDRFISSGWMGDGESGSEFLSLDPALDDDSSEGPIAFKMVYRSGGPQKWAGIYWQNRPNNWGEYAGEDLSDFQCLTFRAKGISGREVVEFKSGGIEALGREFRDSFEVTTGRVTLSTDWKSFSLDLSDSDLSSVIGGFAVILTAQPGRSEIGLVVDDVIFTDDVNVCKE